MQGLFVPLAIMLSPRNLALAGNGAGIGGIVFVCLLLISAVVAMRTARSMEEESCVEGTNNKFCSSLVVGMLWSARVVALAALAVSWLGIAGYAFNEVFAIWFPNLGASFLILILALASCFLPDTKKRMLFYCAISISFCGFLYVSIMATQPVNLGAFYPSSFPKLFYPLVPNELLKTGFMPWFNLIFLSVLGFVGFDLALKPGKSSILALPSIILTAVAFTVFLWGALLLLTPEQLAGSYVPHFKVARKALGETGRVVMGIVVVVGSFTAVFGVFRVLAENLTAAIGIDNGRWAQAVPVILSFIIGAAMAIGWAGDPDLESIIAAGLLFWFIGYGVVDLIATLRVIKIGGCPFLSVLAFLLHIFTAVMVLNFIESLQCFIFTIIFLILCTIVVAVLNKRKNNGF